MMSSLLATLLTLHLVRLVGSEPTLSFPFNAQLPPVARIGQLFSYSFSPQTFQSGSNITYTLGNHPSWLSLESDGRRLYGTPENEDVPLGDVVGQLVDIIATDNTGSTSMNATLVVSRNKAPSVQIPLSQQIENFGHFSAPSSILSYPATEFKYPFDPNTFGTQQNINYYAVSNDSSPLPAWIQFNTASLTFSGITPAFESLIQPPQTFDFNLVASDVVGFSATSLFFSIVVGSHKLTTDNPIISLNATRGSKLSHGDLEQGVKLDDKPVQPGYLNVSTDGMPAWLSFDTNTQTLEGTPENDDHATNFTINFHDAFADTLSVLVEINVATGLFQSTFGDIQVQPGGTFNLDLAPYFWDPEDIDVSIDADPQEDWLQVDGFKVSGIVPKTAKGSFNLSVEATSKSSGLGETEVIHAFFLAPDGTMTTSASSSSSATSEPTKSAAAADSQSDRLGTSEILLATLIPILVVALLIMSFVCFMRRRRHRRNYLSNKKKISGPVPSSLRINGSEVGSVQHMGIMAGTGQPDMQSYKNGKVMYAEVTSQLSSRPRSSETLGNVSVVEVLPALMASGARSITTRSVSTPGREDERDSWVTVEGSAAISKSDKSTRSPRSDTTLPESTRQFLPESGFLTDVGDETFGSTLGLTIASLDNLPNMQPVPPMTYRPPGKHRSIGAYSTTTSSSAALPPSLLSSQGAHSRGLAGRGAESSREPNWETLEESEAAESISELRRPDQARLSSHQWLSRRGTCWNDGESMNDGRSFQTEPSFGSSENWRIIGRREASVIYQDLVDEVAVNLSRPSSARDGAQPGERHSLELMSPSKWGDDEPKSTTWPRPRSSTSVISKLSDDGSVFGEREAVAKAMAAAWRREDSAKASEGSFTMFI